MSLNVTACSLSLDRVRFLEQHVLFKDLDVSFLVDLANLMQTRVYNDSDYIIRKGEIGRAMFFVLRGVVEVVSEDGMRRFANSVIPNGFVNMLPT